MVPPAPAMQSQPVNSHSPENSSPLAVIDRLLVVGGVRVAHVDFEGSAEVEFLHSSLARVVAVAGRGKQISARIKTEQVELDVLLVQRDGLDGEK